MAVSWEIGESDFPGPAEGTKTQMGSIVKTRREQYLVLSWFAVYCFFALILYHDFSCPLTCPSFRSPLATNAPKKKKRATLSVKLFDQAEETSQSACLVMRHLDIGDRYLDRHRGINGWSRYISDISISIACLFTVRDGMNEEHVEPKLSHACLDVFKHNHP